MFLGLGLAYPNMEGDTAPFFSETKKEIFKPPKKPAGV
jgi:hypothetical protein